jgi:hypothetical protein
VSGWRPDVSHLLLFASFTDKELVVPPCSTATTKRVLPTTEPWDLVVVLPHSDETFWEKQEQGCKNGLFFSCEFSTFEDVVIVIPAKRWYYYEREEGGEYIREVGLTPPSNGISLTTEE